MYYFERNLQKSTPEACVVLSPVPWNECSLSTTSCKKNNRLLKVAAVYIFRFLRHRFYAQRVKEESWRSAGVWMPQGMLCLMASTHPRVINCPPLPRDHYYSPWDVVYIISFIASNRMCCSHKTFIVSNSVCPWKFMYRCWIESIVSTYIYRRTYISLRWSQTVKQLMRRYNFSRLYASTTLQRFWNCKQRLEGLGLRPRPRSLGVCLRSRIVFRVAEHKGSFWNYVIFQDPP